jgi:MFS family permease
MKLEQRDGSRSIGDLLRELVEGGVTLMRDEVALAKLEVGGRAKLIGAGTAYVAAGAVIGALGALSLVIGLVLLAGDQWLAADRYWLAALIGLVVTGGAAALLVKRGMALVSPRRLTPEATVATLKEDKEWLKHRLTSGATSS